MMKRREFLRTAAVAASALAVSGPLEEKPYCQVHAFSSFDPTIQTELEVGSKIRTRSTVWGTNRKSTICGKRRIS